MLNRTMLGVVAILSLLAGTNPAVADTEQPVPLAAYQNRVLFMKDLCGDGVQFFTAEGVLKGSCEKPVSFTVAGLMIKSIKIKTDMMVIKADRYGLYRPFSRHDREDAAKTPDLSLHLVPVKLSMRLEIAGPATARDPKEQDFAPALAAIFAQGFAEMEPTLPLLWRNYFATHPDGHTPPAPPPDALPKESDPDFKAYKFPELLYSTDPAFTPEAKAAHADVLSVRISTEGLVEDAQIVIPAGLGLDEKAVEAVKEYRFNRRKKTASP
jgi:hypothetical protein